MTNSRKNNWNRPLIHILLGLWIGSAVTTGGQAYAGMIYDFIHTTGNVLATIEFNGSAPFDHNDVNSFSVTTQGANLLSPSNFLPAGPYSGTFTSSNGAIISDGSQGLTGTLIGFASLLSSDAPDMNGTSSGELQVEVSPINVPDRIVYNDGSIANNVSGQWRIVPEPATGLSGLLAWAALILGGRLRSR